MLDRRVIQLTREIRDLYAHSRTLADRYNGVIEDDQRALIDACRAGPSRISELNYFENIFDRQEAVQSALADPRIRRRTNWLHGVLWVVLFAMVWQLAFLTAAYFMALASSALIIMTMLYVQEKWVFGGETFRRLLREQLTARGVPICIGCGYDLRGQVEPRCPECGRPASLVRPTKPTGGATHVH